MGNDVVCHRAMGAQPASNHAVRRRRRPFGRRRARRSVAVRGAPLRPPSSSSRRGRPSGFGRRRMKWRPPSSGTYSTSFPPLVPRRPVGEASSFARRLWIPQAILPGKVSGNSNLSRRVPNKWSPCFYRTKGRPVCWIYNTNHLCPSSADWGGGGSLRPSTVPLRGAPIPPLRLPTPAGSM